MTKSLLAFFLASLTTYLSFAGFTFIAAANLPQRPVQVVIRSDVDVHDIITAIAALHRQDVDVQTTKKSVTNWKTSLSSAPAGALGLMFMTGLILFFYKRYCRWLGILPTI